MSEILKRGSRVQLSDRGRKRFSPRAFPRTEGVIRGYSSDEFCYLVKWNTLKTSEVLHMDFVEPLSDRKPGGGT